MSQENNHSKNSGGDFTFKTDVVPIHRTRTGGPIIGMAHERVTLRNESSETAAKAAADLAYLQELRELPPPRNIFRRKQQRRALNSWLQREGYTTPDEAHERLTTKHETATEDAQELSTGIEQVWLPKVREVLGDLHQDDKTRADKLFRAHDFPGDALETCEKQAAESGRDPNLLEWLSQKPTAEAPFGASNEQLESVLLWNAFCTERMAANPEAVEGMVNDYLSNINQKVDEGQLDASWTQATPAISQVVVGDIMDIRFLGYGGTDRGGHYNRDNQTLTLWPYELENEDNNRHVCEHECTHALGGFKEKWLNEGFAEAFTRIINDEDPFGKSEVYNMNRQGVKKILEGAGVTCKDASAFFVGQDTEANEARLGDYLASAYDGHDVLGTINKAYRESFGGDDTKLHNQTQDEAFFVAAYTATIIGDLFNDARHDPQAVAEYTKDLALHTESDLKYIALKHAYGLFADMADRQERKHA